MNVIHPAPVMAAKAAIRPTPVMAAKAAIHAFLSTKKKELLFVNKKRAARPASKKTLFVFRHGRFHHRAKRSKKVFWFFFSKKNALRKSLWNNA